MICYKHDCIYCFEGNCMANASDPVNEVDECEKYELTTSEKKTEENNS